MTWRVVSPEEAQKRDVKVVRVQVPSFPDDIDYERILGRAFTDPSSLDWLASGGVVILATPDAFDAVKRTREMSTRRGLRDELARLTMARQVVTLQRGRPH